MNRRDVLGRSALLGIGSLLPVHGYAQKRYGPGASDTRSGSARRWPTADRRPFAETATQMLKQCGDDLTRENVMKQALNLDFQPAMLLPGVRVKTGLTDYAPVSTMKLQRFDAKSWVLFGDLVQA